MPSLTKTVKLGEWLERLTRLQVSWPSFMPCSSLPAIQKLPSIQYLIFSSVWSFMIPPPDFNLPVRVCSDEPILGTKNQKRGQWWNTAVSNFQFLLRFSMAETPAFLLFMMGYIHLTRTIYLLLLLINLPVVDTFDIKGSEFPKHLLLINLNQDSQTDSSAPPLIFSYQRWIGWWSHQYLCFIKGTTIRLQSVSPSW